MSFLDEYDRLNSEQKKAVDTIDGPLLVIAGPGTGKTQLLSARVANILASTDVSPSNILCLTFTESGAANMRERLSRFIGPDAYNVTISTYHALGSDIINRYPEYFDTERLDEPVDKLTQYRIVEDIVAALRYDDPLKQSRYHLKDLIATISELKRALLTSEDVKQIARENTSFYKDTDEQLASIMEGFTSMPRKVETALPTFTAILQMLEELPSPEHPPYSSLASLAKASLATAILRANNDNKTKPLTDWKNDWLEKDKDNHFVFEGKLATRRLTSIADALSTYQAVLSSRGLFDFDDMILKVIAALESHEDLRFSLQEKYQYILLDEYQDTNAAQAKLVKLLTDNPVSEGRPNVMAVGDDDQAIYAFQGAQYSNMIEFFDRYRETNRINLKTNYRSSAPILELSEKIGKQISSRLTSHFKDLDKSLEPFFGPDTPALIERRDFLSPIAERQFIAMDIAVKIKEGDQNASDFAILAKRHRTLEEIVPYLRALDVPMRYEKRENILESPVIQDLRALSAAVLALSSGERDSHLWHRVLAVAAFEIPIHTAWELSWTVSDSNRPGATPLRWPQAMLAHEDERVRRAALIVLGVAARATDITGEQALDELFGSRTIVSADSAEPVTSPLRDYYAGLSDGALYDALSNLTVLRHIARDYYKSEETSVSLRNIFELVSAYEAAGEHMLNTSPYASGEDAVTLMTVFKAKGLEYNHVYLPSTDQSTWTDRGSSNKLTIPANLAPIRHAGADDDENVRLFFVALTRARRAITMTSHLQTFTGKATSRLGYLDEREEDDEFTSLIIPKPFEHVIITNDVAPSPELLELDAEGSRDNGEKLYMPAILKERVEKYRLSPTHLNTFTDLQYGGPENFFIGTILRYETAPSPESEFGNAVHETLQWVSQAMVRERELPDIAGVLEYFRARLIIKQLSDQEKELLTVRGEIALKAYMDQRSGMFRPSDKSEVSFSRDNVYVGPALMGGKIDRMEIDESTKTIVVVDYKTGSPHGKWDRIEKLHKYRQQLYCYKLLIDNSPTYKEYTVKSGRIEFVEPDEDGVVMALPLEFDDREVEETKGLIEALWTHVQDLNFPNVDAYPPRLSGIVQFEKDLLEGKI